MGIQEKFNAWLAFADSGTKRELLSVKNDEKALEDRFYKELQFGTGGLRGIMGAGTNRMNKYTVGRATLGLANYLKHKYKSGISVAIAYDTRNHSAAFARTAAECLALNGVETVYLYEMPVPVPVLSYTTRALGCRAGVMITASHNPKEYNGYKVYDAKGCQLCTAAAGEVLGFINAAGDYAQIDFSFDTRPHGAIEMLGGAMLEQYLGAVRAESLYDKKSDIKIVYTPLHGTGNIPVRKILSGFDVRVVASQQQPDGDFPTVKSPNPEERGALRLGIEEAEKTGADLVLGTDPDCDRVGVAARGKDGQFVLLTGNQTGALLVHFVLEMKKSCLSEKSVIIKTIVTSELGAEIAKRHGVGVQETLTGFKYIGDKINRFEKSGEHEFVMGYEESYGYLVGTYARDKDAVVSSMLICQMAAWYKAAGKTLIDALGDLYAEYGYYLDALDSFVLAGKAGAEKIVSLMSGFRARGGALFYTVSRVVDYSQGVGGLPKENVLKYIFADSSWLAVRPSGTEPKIKVYYSIKDKSRENAARRLEELRAKLSEIIMG